MKNVFLLLVFNITSTTFLCGQNMEPDDRQKKDIYSLIEKYSRAREKRDTILLKSILTTDVDQLVSSGEWRNGVDASVKGMLNSSTTNTGKRTLNIEKVRLLSPVNAIVECKYEIHNTDGTTRKMWSTFIIVSDNGIWKIKAIRNMLPTER